MSDVFDVVIVGAGIAGSALACALSVNQAEAVLARKKQPSLHIALVEANTLRQGWPPCEAGVDDFDPRVSALTVASQQLLEDIGVWSSIADQRISPFEQMRVWEADGTGAMHFDAADVRAALLGHIVENRVTVAALLNRIRASNNIRVFDGSAVADIQLPPELADSASPDPERVDAATLDQQNTAALATVSLANGRRLQGSLIVAADGANSPLRKLVGLPVREWDYRHDAIACTVKVANGHQKTAWQRFTPTGPLAFLPLQNPGDPAHCHQYCSIVWSQTRDRAEQLMALDDGEFCKVLAAEFEHRLGDVEAVSKRFCFPLSQKHAVDYIKPGFALIADAAHAIHPLAGQGINLGLADVKVLADGILDAVRRERSVADVAMLGRYQRQRKVDNLAMMAAVEGFKRAFEPLPLPLRWLRNTGMNVLDKQPAIKNQIIRYAMGLA